jgi:hypothetical protein
MTVRAVGSAELPNERCEFRLQLTCPWHQPRAVRRLVSGDDPIRAYLAGGRLAPDGHRSVRPRSQVRRRLAGGGGGFEPSVPREEEAHLRCPQKELCSAWRRASETATSGQV